MTAQYEFRVQSSEFRVRKQSGFTLIELLIAIAIIALIGGVAIPNLYKFSKFQQLQTTSSQVANTLKTAQSSAQSRIKCPRGESSDKWIVTLASNNYSLSAECQTTGNEVLFTKSYSPSSDAGSSYEGILNVCNTNGVQTTVFVIFDKNQASYQCFGDPAISTGQIELTLQDPSDAGNSAVVKIEEGGVIKVE